MEEKDIPNSVKERFEEIGKLSFLPDKINAHSEVVEVFVSGCIRGYLIALNNK